jgi:hypothetical protein
MVIARRRMKTKLICKCRCKSNRDRMLFYECGDGANDFFDA